MNKTTLMMVIAAVIALGTGVSVQRMTAQIQTDLSVSTQPSPLVFDVALSDIHAQPQPLSQWRGKLLIINFWASWCPPCLTEIPAFVQLQDELKNDNIQFIGIAIEEAESVIAFLQKKPVNYPILIGDSDGIRLSQQWGNQAMALPFTVLVNDKGEIVYRHFGELSKNKLLDVIKQFKHPARI